MGKLNLGKWKEGFVESLELPKDLMYGAVLVSITGRQELLIENYRGILAYKPSGENLQAYHTREKPAHQLLHQRRNENNRTD